MPKPRDHLKFWRRESPPPQIPVFPSMIEPFTFYTYAIQNAIGAVLAQVQKHWEGVICYASKSFSKTQSRYSTTKVETLAFGIFTGNFKHYLLRRKFQIAADHRVLQWLHNFKDLDGLTARWLEKLTAFENLIVHRSGKSIGTADFMSRTPNQDVTTDQAIAPTRSAETKHPTQNNVEASNTERPKSSSHGRRKKPITYQKKPKKPKLQHQQLYMGDDEQEGSQHNFDFVQIFC